MNHHEADDGVIHGQVRGIADDQRRRGLGLVARPCENPLRLASLLPFLRRRLILQPELPLSPHAGQGQPDCGGCSNGPYPRTKVAHVQLDPEWEEDYGLGHTRRLATGWPATRQAAPPVSATARVSSSGVCTRSPRDRRPASARRTGNFDRRQRRPTLLHRVGDACGYGRRPIQCEGRGRPMARADMRRIGGVENWSSIPVVVADES